MGEFRIVDAGWFRVENKTRQREIGDGRALAHHEAARGKMLAQHAARRARTDTEKLGNGRLAGFLEPVEEAQGSVITGELVIIEEDPAPDLASLTGILRAEFIQNLGEVIQDGARLGERFPAMFEDGNFALDIQVGPPFGVARDTAEIINRDDLPVGATKLKHQGHLVGIPGFAEPVQTKLCHGNSGGRAGRLLRHRERRA